MNPVGGDVFPSSSAQSDGDLKWPTPSGRTEVEVREFCTVSITRQLEVTGCSGVADLRIDMEPKTCVVDIQVRRRQCIVGSVQMNTSVSCPIGDETL